MLTPNCALAHVELAMKILHVPQGLWNTAFLCHLRKMKMSKFFPMMAYQYSLKQGLALASPVCLSEWRNPAKKD